MAQWIDLGKTPVNNVKLLWAQYALRIVKNGYETVEVTTESQPLFGTTSIILDPIGRLPSHMVHVSAGEVDVDQNPVKVDEFLIGKYEVTNREYKTFVDAGGYREAKYWKFPFVKDGRTLSFEQAVALFVDKTDRYAPSTWDLGAYPAGQDDYPVEWSQLVRSRSLCRIRRHESAHGLSLVRCGQRRHRFNDSPGEQFLQERSRAGRQLSRPGTVWHLRHGGERQRVVLQFGREPAIHTRWFVDRTGYMYQGLDARSPWDRSESNGFRLMQTIGSKPVPENLLSNCAPRPRTTAASGQCQIAFFAFTQACTRTIVRPLMRAWNPKTTVHPTGGGSAFRSKQHTE